LGWSRVAEALGKEQFPPAPGGVLDAVMKTGRTVHVSDLAAAQGYLERHPGMVAGVELENPIWQHGSDQLGRRYFGAKDLGGTADPARTWAGYGPVQWQAVLGILRSSTELL
jgi:hypothetical protein